MDYLHAAILYFVLSGTFFMTTASFYYPAPLFTLGVVYIIAYLRERNKPAVRCGK